MIDNIINFFKGLKSNSMETKLPANSLVVDVRTPEEFALGHYQASVNIPLNLISDHISDFKLSERPIVVVCRSGMRSSNAVKLLKSNGVSATNGGAWKSLDN